MFNTTHSLDFWWKLELSVLIPFYILVPDRDACQITVLHHEDNGMNIEMAKLAFLAAIWSPGIDGDRRQSRWKNA
jgi:hypothetical protein